VSRLRIRCTVTRFNVDHDQPGGVLISSTREEIVGCHVERGYLFLHNSAASALVEDLLRGAREEGRGWSAQFGTHPVCINGRWGGRNYPAIHVSAADLIEALDPPKEESA
jgi:hypothetical protein